MFNETCKTCRFYDYNPAESKIPYCEALHHDTHRDDWCSNHSVDDRITAARNLIKELGKEAEAH